MWRPFESWISIFWNKLLEIMKPGTNLQNLITANMAMPKQSCLEALVMTNAHNRAYCKEYAEVKYTKVDLKTLNFQESDLHRHWNSTTETWELSMEFSLQVEVRRKPSTLLRPLKTPWKLQIS